MQNPQYQEEDREFAEWLRKTVRKLKRAAKRNQNDDGDPFADPAVRRRVAELISRSHKA
jgi:hypothetical protein